MTKYNTVDLKLKRMVELLQINDSGKEWEEALAMLRVEFQHSPKHASSKLLSMYGGMGSLNDIILYRNGQLLLTENNEFDVLREQLYDQVKMST